MFKSRLNKVAETENLLFLLILIIGSLLRFYQFNSWSFTNDELSALSRLDYDSFIEMLDIGVKNDVHPALTQIFEYLWTRVFDPSTIRFPFVLFGILSIYFAFKTACIWIKKFSALFVAAFIAVSEYFVLYSQIARPYSLGCFLVLIFAFYWSLYLKGNRSNKVSIALIIAAVLAILTHYFASLTVVLILICGFFMERRKNKMPYAIHIALIAILCVPHLYITIHHLKMGGLEGWLPKPEPDFLPRLLDYISNDFYVFQLTLLFTLISPILFFREKFAPKKWVFWGLLIFLSCFLIGYIYSVEANPVIQFSSFIFSIPFLLIAIFSLTNYEKHKIAGIFLLVLIILTGIYGTVIRNNFYGPKKFADFKAVSQNLKLFHDSLGSENILIFMNANHPDYFKYYFDQQNFHPSIEKQVIENFEDIADIKQRLDSSNEEYAIIAWANKFMPYEVHELVKQDFPKRIYHQHYFNSEFSVYKKEAFERKLLFTKVHTLEKEIDNWDVNWQKRDTNQFVSKNHSLHIDSTSLYSMTYRTNIAHLFGENSRFLTISLFAKMHTLSDCKIVVSVIHKGEQIEWRGYDIQNYYQEGKWFNPLFVFEKRADFEDEDEITIYLWNPSKSELWVDDFSLKVFEDSDYDYYNLYPPKK